MTRNNKNDIGMLVSQYIHTIWNRKRYPEAFAALPESPVKDKIVKLSNDPRYKCTAVGYSFTIRGWMSATVLINAALDAASIDEEGNLVIKNGPTGCNDSEAVLMRNWFNDECRHVSVEQMGFDEFLYDHDGATMTLAEIRQERKERERIKKTA